MAGQNHKVTAKTDQETLTSQTLKASTRTSDCLTSLFYAICSLVELGIRYVSALAFGYALVDFFLRSDFVLIDLMESICS